MADFGIDIVGKKVWLWADDSRGFRTYSISIKNKTKEGKDDYMSIDVRLPKGSIDYPNKTLINFEGFPSFRSYEKDGKTYRVPMIIFTKLWVGGENTPQYEDPDEVVHFDDLDDVVGFAEANDDIPF